jgi:glyoxylase-like metal-dependent hydrolase (beta-lactamase superfamily II)
MPSTGYTIEPVVSAPFEQVSYIIWKAGREDALVVDPGFDPESIVTLLERQQLRPAAILNTHGHADHIAGNAHLKRVFPEAPLIIGAGEAHLLSDAEANLSAPFGLPIRSPAADRLVREGEILDLAGFQLTVREIPGHSPGHVVYIATSEEPPFVIGGDVLFQGSVGRTDFPGGSARALITGIQSKLFTLPGETLILPGHGGVTTVDQEKRLNPFVGTQADPSAFFDLSD